MVDTLLRELSNVDLDWIIASGKRHQLSAGQPLQSLENTHDFIYIVIDGVVGLVDLPDTRAQSTMAVNELHQGEIINLEALFDRPAAATARTLAPATLMSLTVAQVQAKLAEDIAFAAHFYRAIALMLSGRLRRLFEHPDRVRFWGDRSGKEVLSVFGELRDSDVDWLVSFGHTQSVAPGKVLLQAGRPVDALYLLLDGQMAISAPEGAFNPLALCFSGLEISTRHQAVFATLSKGSMPGIISFLDFRPLPVTVRAQDEALVFAVPRQTLVTKLQVDDSFASRFYRVIAIEILEMLQADSDSFSQVQGAAEADEELDIDALQQVSEGAKKFNWMLSQLGVS